MISERASCFSIRRCFRKTCGELQAGLIMFLSEKKVRHAANLSSTAESKMFQKKSADVNWPPPSFMNHHEPAAF